MAAVVGEKEAVEFVTHLLNDHFHLFRRANTGHIDVQDLRIQPLQPKDVPASGNAENQQHQADHRSGNGYLVS